MGSTASYIQSERRLKVSDYENTARELEDLLPRRLPYFYKIAFRFLGNTADAEDAVQDALLTAYKHLDQFRGEAQLSTWLTTIVCNSARMQLRRRPRYTHVSLDEPIVTDDETFLSERLASERPSPEDDCRYSEMKRQVARASTRLTPALRKTLQLRDGEDLSVRETAKILGVASGTVKAQLSRARGRMRQLLSKQRSGTHRLQERLASRP